FDTQKQTVLLLEDLQHLSPDVAMTFHQFMDGENSRIKSTFVILTLTYPQNITVETNVSLKKLSNISAQELERLWKDSYSKDNLDCLINRIATNTVVLVN